MELRQVLQEMVNESHESLVNMAKIAVNELSDALMDVFQDRDMVSKTLILLCVTSLASDDEFNQKEYEFLCDVFGDMPTEDAVALINSYKGDESIDLVNGFLDACPIKLKSRLITFCCCFLASDEKFSVSEIEFVQKLCE